MVNGTEELTKVTKEKEGYELEVMMLVGIGKRKVVYQRRKKHLSFLF